MLEPERKSASNAIWLCTRCHRLVDGDDSTYTPNELYDWKSHAIARARRATETGKVRTGPTREVREHDRALFLASNHLMSEPALHGFLECLDPDETFAYSDDDPLHMWNDFFYMEGNQYLIPSLRERAQDLRKELLNLISWLRTEAFSMPNSPGSHSDLPRRVPKEPGNVRYERLRQEMPIQIAKAEECYRRYRRAIKEQLII